MIKILIDSSADLTPQEISQKKVIMIPLQVTIQDKTYLDGINLDHDTFYNFLTSSDEFPTALILKGLYTVIPLYSYPLDKVVPFLPCS